MITDSIVTEDLDEAFHAYGKVIHLIRLNPYYPEKFRATEAKEQHELEAYFRLAALPLITFYKGVTGTHAYHLLSSPSASDEDKKIAEDHLHLYQKFGNRTLDSLADAIENAGICAGLPQKSYFNPDYHDKVTRHCALNKEISERFLPLERERVAILDNAICGDIMQCPRYSEVLENKMSAIAREERVRIAEIWD